MNLPKPDISDSDTLVLEGMTEAAGKSSHKYQLPTHPRLVGQIPYVSSDTLARIMTDPSSNPFHHIIIFDARSTEEWVAGHIHGSHHAQTVEMIVPHLPSKSTPDNVGVLIYCEFSSHRGPSLAEGFRNCDMMMNLSTEIPLAYPETYLIAGGFSEFFTHYPKLCYGYYLREEACVHTIRRCRSQSSVICKDFLAECVALRQPTTPTGLGWNPFERMSPVPGFQGMGQCRNHFSQ
jgi:hypothetical protein